MFLSFFQQIIRYNFLTSICQRDIMILCKHFERSSVFTGIFGHNTQSNHEKTINVPVCAAAGCANRRKRFRFGNSDQCNY